MNPASVEVQEQVKKLQSFISDHFISVLMKCFLDLARCMMVGEILPIISIRWVVKELLSLYSEQ